MVAKNQWLLELNGSVPHDSSMESGFSTNFLAYLSGNTFFQTFFISTMIQLSTDALAHSGRSHCQSRRRPACRPAQNERNILILHEGLGSRYDALQYISRFV